MIVNIMFAAMYSSLAVLSSSTYKYLLAKSFNLSKILRLECKHSNRTRVDKANIWPPNFGKFETLYCLRVLLTV